jgi:hypothetical protein
MTDPRERIDEYLDGLLDGRERGAFEDALRADPALREEVERARHFERLLVSAHDGRAEERGIQRVLQSVHRRKPRGIVFRIGATVAAAAALLLWAYLNAPKSHEEEVESTLIAEAEAYGTRLGEIAAERRAGRVPRKGLSGLAVPSDAAAGVVFAAALRTLGVETGELERVQRLVRDHFVSLPGGEDLEAERARAEASLTLFRQLRLEADREVADAYYDVFRPGLADLRTARRIDPGAIVLVENGERYEESYFEALHRLERRYGRRKLDTVLAHLAPTDRRAYYRDASQDGVGRDAVLAIRAELYEAAHNAGVDHLYVPLG